jgi:hypothetical protein
MREKISRFVQYLDYKGINDNQATVECGLSNGLIGQARSGKSDLGAKTIDKILNTYQDLSRVWLLAGEGNMLTEPEHPEVSNPTESSLVDYLERKVSDQEILIRELYQQIGMLEAKLDLARKGEIARTADGSSVVKAG